MKVFESKLNSHANILLTCEHASDFIPKAFKNLGLTKGQLAHGKGVYDLGSLALMRALQLRLNSSFLYHTVSRLVIDANRHLNGAQRFKNAHHAPALKTKEVIGTKKGDVLIDIPGNIVKDYVSEEKKRWVRYAKPYWLRGKSLVRAMQKKHDEVYVIYIHSFFPVFNNEVRKEDIDVLAPNNDGASLRIAQKVKNNLSKSTSLAVALNKPWAFKDADNGAFADLVGEKGIRVFSFDINNKHLKSKRGINEMADLIAGTLLRVLKTS